jgi:hypothetical protein
MGDGLWEGARRLPYFFTWEHGEGPRYILCPQCALQHADAPERLEAHYHVSRSVMCARCGILLGPTNDEEMISLERHD